MSSYTLDTRTMAGSRRCHTHHTAHHTSEWNGIDERVRLLRLACDSTLRRTIYELWVQMIHRMHTWSLLADGQGACEALCIRQYSEEDWSCNSFLHASWAQTAKHPTIPYECSERSPLAGRCVNPHWMRIRRILSDSPWRSAGDIWLRQRQRPQRRLGLERQQRYGGGGMQRKTRRGEDYWK